MKVLFRDKNLQEQFDEQGYVKFPLLSTEEVQNLVHYYQEISKNNHSQIGFHISLDNPNLEFVRETTRYIESVLGPKILPQLQNGMIFTGSFTIKEPGNHFIVPPHQDWTFVEEDKFCSATVWVPLQQVTTENGALGVIRGSHKVFDQPRPSPSPQAQSPFSKHTSTLFSFLEVMDMQAGEALVFNNALIHASPPNTSSERRLAVGIGITQASASLVHYYQLPDSNPAELEKYEVDKDFFIHFNNPKLSQLYDAGGSVPGYKKIGSSKRVVTDLSTEEMLKRISALKGTKRNTALAEKLASLLTPQPSTMSTENQNPGNDKKHEATPKPAASIDNRTFFEKYTIKNIIAEIKWRLSDKK